LQREEVWSALMRRALDGDDAAYRQLLETLGGGLRATVRGRFLRAGMGNGEVEDVVQETLLAVHLKRHTWDRSERLGPWIAAIARNKLVDVMRRRSLVPLVPLEGIEESLFAAADTTEEARHDVNTVLESLDERQRAIVQLVSIEGRSCRQVGDALRMTEVAVRVALHRALKTLAQLYRARPS
jgi:RNA polymerase sigma-70 factor (ECF subfamily)